MAKEKLVSVAEYALMCGITLQAVHNRERAGTIKFAKHDPVLLIDLSVYPAKKMPIGRRPYKSKV